MLKYDNNNPETIYSAVCFVDILGFSQLVQDSFNAGTGNDLLKRLHKTLTDGINSLRPREEYVGVLKTFTDNIVIGHPIYEDGESQLGGIFLDFAAYQLSMALEGFFVRGAVSIGEYYADNEFAFGPALLEAHQLESEEAITPRIILSNETRNMVHEHINYYADPKWAPQSRDLLKDNVDGNYFINYLETVMGEKEPQDYQFAYTLLQNHKAIIEENLARFQHNPRVFPKYEWAAQYHNFFSDLNFNNTHNSQLQILNVANGDFSLIV
ncbi:hypothetical protein ACFSTA_20360 [Ornithinibacillus salinisoli]|uniref:Guanylate cyclase domain-containing protein n=1 Tax=Ornithinibacillus salinisoli TaxID=1848459 RepID=A0ABW4W721_9BACI